MEQRWLDLAKSYEFTERLSRFVKPFRKVTRDGGRRERPPGRLTMSNGLGPTSLGG